MFFGYQKLSVPVSPVELADEKPKSVGQWITWMLYHELPHVREAKSTDCPHGIRPPGNTYLPTDFSEEPYFFEEAEEKTKAMEQIITLMQLRGVGPQSSWILVMEFFVWRKFKNRRELAACAGLTPTPYDSGSSQREQGLICFDPSRPNSAFFQLGAKGFIHALSTARQL